MLLRRSFAWQHDGEGASVDVFEIDLDRDTFTESHVRDDRAADVRPFDEERGDARIEKRRSRRAVGRGVRVERR